MPPKSSKEDTASEKRSYTDPLIEISKRNEAESKIDRLSPPPYDTRQEHFVSGSDEAMLDNVRKKTREYLLDNSKKGKQKVKKNKFSHLKTDFQHGRSVIKTGNRAIDNHSRPSTLEGESAFLLDKFRQRKLVEFNKVVKLCEDRDVQLSRALLEKVLLYPPEKPHSILRKKIRQPGNLLSESFANPDKGKNDNDNSLNQNETRSGKVLIDSRYFYPPYEKVKPRQHKMVLSSGKACISRKIDCWMTFEEYDKLTSAFATQYKMMYGGIDDNAFWPGNLLDKLRLCMPPYDKHQHPGASSVFQQTSQPKSVVPGHYTALKSWPVSDQGFVQYGDIHLYKGKN